jgi:DNA repair protein RecO
VAKYQRTEGLCLRRLDYSDTSQVASFLTPGAGRQSFMAKGVWRAPKRGIRCAFELLGRYELIYTERRYGSLLNLTGRSLLEGFLGLRQSLDRILCGYYAAELSLDFTAEDQPCAEFYELVLESLRRFETGQNLGLSVLLLEIGALKEYGSCPAFDACAECDRKLALSGRLLFSPSNGGPLCQECGRRMYQEPTAYAFPVDARKLALLSELASQPPTRPERVSVEPEQIAEASRILRLQMRYLLGKELRMWKHLPRPGRKRKT